VGRRIKVKLQDSTPARVIHLDPAATEGATLGTNLFTPDGTVGTPATVRAWLSLSTTSEVSPTQGGSIHHKLLQGLPVGDDHPQYLRKDTLTTQGDIYVRGALVPQRLSIGTEGQVLKVIAGVPAWGTDEQAVVTIIGAYGEIVVDSSDPANPVLSLGAGILLGIDLAETAVQPEDLALVAFTGDYDDLINTPPDISGETFITANDETGTLINSRRLNAGTNISFNTSTPGILTISASGGGGGGTVDTIIGAYGEIIVDSSDPANPVLSLGAGILLGIDLAETAVQPADLAGYVPTSRQIISGAGLTGGGDLSADRTLAVGAGTGITVNADDVQVSAAYQALINGAIQSSVLTTDGDLLTRAGGVPARIAIGSNGQVLTVVSGAPAWAAASGGATGANPTASVGLAAVNGSATTFLRSDGAPALDQGIVPTWTGAHIFAASSGTPLTISTAAPVLAQIETDQAADGKRWTTRVVNGEWAVGATLDDNTTFRPAFAAQRNASSSAIEDIIIGNGTNDPDLNLLITELMIQGDAGSAGEVLTSGGAGVAPSWATAPGAPADIQIFTATGASTWNKPSGAAAVEVIVIGAGGGGASARKGAAASVRNGSGGGGGGGLSRMIFRATDLSSSVSVTVGTGGTGGPAITNDNTNGANGTDGGVSSFGSYLTANPGTGKIFGGSDGLGGTGLTSNGSNGGPGGASGAAGVAGSASGLAGAGGGGGGGVTSGNVQNAGAAGGAHTFGGLTGGTGGAAGGTNGGAGNTHGNGAAGTGGGGGGGNSTAGGNGGSGGAAGGKGAGGGGGGAATNGAGSSGAGANGGNGVVVVITYF